MGWIMMTKGLVWCVLVIPLVMAGCVSRGGASDAQRTAVDGTEGVRAFSWSGYRWRVRPATDQLAFPGPNCWSDSDQSVWVDGDGRLHLAVRYDRDDWYCCEVISQESLGYGRYIFHVDGPLESIDKNLVLGMSTYLDDEHEIDIELTKWGQDRPAVYEQYTVQPYQHQGNMNRADYVPRSSVTTFAFTWLKDRIVFESFVGDDVQDQTPYRTWTYTGEHIPEPGSEKVHVNVWLFNGHWPQKNKTHELVLSQFEFVPAGQDP